MKYLYHLPTQDGVYRTQAISFAFSSRGLHPFWSYWGMSSFGTYWFSSRPARVMRIKIRTGRDLFGESLYPQAASRPDLFGSGSDRSPALAALVCWPLRDQKSSRLYGIRQHSRHTMPVFRCWNIALATVAEPSWGTHCACDWAVSDMANTCTGTGPKSEGSHCGATDSITPAVMNRERASFSIA